MFCLSDECESSRKQSHPIFKGRKSRVNNMRQRRKNTSNSGLSRTGSGKGGRARWMEPLHRGMKQIHAAVPPPAHVISNETSKKPFGLAVKSGSQQFCTLSGAHPSGLRGLAAAAASVLFVFSQVLLRGSPEISVLNCFLVQKLRRCI